MRGYEDLTNEQQAAPSETYGVNTNELEKEYQKLEEELGFSSEIKPTPKKTEEPIELSELPEVPSTKKPESREKHAEQG